VLPFLLVLFVVVPLVEIYVIIQVGQAIGALWTVLLLVADSILGSVLMRSQSRSAWRRFQAAVAESRVPARETLDGILVIFGGALLLTPGFVTDIFGLAFLLPPTRAVVRGLLVRNFAARMVLAATGPRSRTRGGREDYDVEGTAVEREQERLP
jgi:UPF0716 protein FxsA